MSPPATSPTRDELRAWMVAHVARELERDPGAIDTAKPLVRYGLDSLAAVTLSGELEELLGRALDPRLLAEHPTIDALAEHLAGEAGEAAGGGPPTAAEAPVAPARADAPPTRFERLAKRVFSFLLRAFYRLRVEGEERLQAGDGFLLAGNHLHVLDTAILFALLPRPPHFVVSTHMRRNPAALFFLKCVFRTIWVARGEGDTGALDAAVAALRAGAIVAMAPEGRISRGEGLLRGHVGLAHVAARAGAAVVPLASWGQERAWRCWLRLRRVPVEMRVGAPIRLPQGPATARRLEEHTDTVMLALARMLPEEYRGHYREVVGRDPGGSGPARAGSRSR